MPSRTFEFQRPIPDDRLQTLFRQALKELAAGSPNPRPIVTELSGRREDDRYPLSTTAVYGSPQIGYRKTMVATTDPETESYLTSLRFETYGLPNGVGITYEFSGRSPWTDPEADVGAGKLVLVGDAAETLTSLEALARKSLGPLLPA